MNAYLHRSENRGHVKAGWLDTYHSFSFGSWYNPKYMGVSALRVINDDYELFNHCCYYHNHLNLNWNHHLNDNDLNILNRHFWMIHMGKGRLKLEVRHKPGV